MLVFHYTQSLCCAIRTGHGISVVLMSVTDDGPEVNDLHVHLDGTGPEVNNLHVHLDGTGPEVNNLHVHLDGTGPEVNNLHVHLAETTSDCLEHE